MPLVSNPPRRRPRVGSRPTCFGTQPPYISSKPASNVIRGWLGHVSLETTNRYAEITVRMKEVAIKLCEPPITDHAPRKPAWRDDAALLTWLASL